MMLRNVWAVIRREYIQRVRTKSFVFGTIAVPLIMVLLIAVPIVIAGRSQDDERHIVVVDRTGVLQGRLGPELEELGWTVEPEPWTPDVEVRLRLRADDGEILGFLMLDDETLEEGVATFQTTVRPTPVRSLTMRSAITRAAMDYRLTESGSAASMLSGGELRIELLSDAPGADPDEEGPQFAVAYMGAMILYMVILIYSVAVMRATLEEKTSRIVEVIVSSMKPWHLLLGKVIGVGAVSLTQLSIWILAASLALAAGVPTLMSARPDLTALVDVQAALPSVGMLALFACFFILGFFMYSGIYAAVGAMCNTDEEANQAQFPVVMLLVGPILMVMPIIQDPSATWAIALSLFPLFSPILMWARVAAGGVPAWQIGLSFVLMALAIVAIAWVAGRIYRVGILMTGKRPTLPELWRWVRAA
ncbi:MAG: ABC transporter permease [Gemmatimonadota bacterium]|nr:ABC transporter permease [Gemmatimonadota bacterium]MDH3423874.1 ABC transporter permease [Gemmatimonadota bacterium]